MGLFQRPLRMLYKRQAVQPDCPICNTLPWGMLEQMLLHKPTAQHKCCTASL